MMPSKNMNYYQMELIYLKMHNFTLQNTMYLQKIFCTFALLRFF